MSGTMDVFLSVFVSSQGEPVKESEENWESRDRALKALGDEASSLSDRLVTGGQLRTVVESILVSTGSLRTTLVITACTTCASLCAALGPAPLDPLVHIMLPRLLKLAGNAKKLVAGAGASAVLALLKHAPLHARTVTTLATGASDKNAQVRAHCVAFLKALMEGAAGDEHARILLDKSGALDTLERCLKKSLSDATPAVREASRGVFDVMRVCWPARAESVLNSLDPSTKKAVMKNPSNFKFAKPSVSLPAKLAMSAISSTPAMLKTSFPRPSSASPTSAPVHGTQLPEHVESEGDEVITMPDTPSQLLANLQSSNEVTVTQAISSMDSNLLRQFSPGQFSDHCRNELPSPPPISSSCRRRSSCASLHLHPHWRDTRPPSEPHSRPPRPPQKLYSDSPGTHTCFAISEQVPPSLQHNSNPWRAPLQSRRGKPSQRRCAIPS
ncbi:clasp N terminal-domain-containing protein [Chytriomyces sp. MP71]|nr:clasp N terminal-domain-containing protein [Chytriomyces sp. MP71]